MQKSQHLNYLKLSFNRIEIGKLTHLSGGQKWAYLWVYASWVNNDSKKQNQLIPVRLSGTLSDFTSRFESQIDQWDCIVLSKDQIKSNCSLKLQFQITRNKYSRYQTNHSSKIISEQKGQKKGTLSQFLYKSQQYIIPAQKFLKHPFTIHQIALDLYIHHKNTTPEAASSLVDTGQDFHQNSLKQQKYAESSQLIIETGKKNPTDYPQKSRKRDGIVNFEIIFLPSTKIEVQFSKFMLTTDLFAKQYKLHIIYKKNYQSNQNFNRLNRLGEKWSKKSAQAYVNQESNKILLNQQDLYSKSQVLLQINGDKTYMNRQSMKSPQILPIVMQNSLDQIKLLLEFQWIDPNELKSKDPQRKKVVLEKGISFDEFHKRQENKKVAKKQRITFTYEDYHKKHLIVVQFKYKVNLQFPQIDQQTSKEQLNVLDNNQFQEAKQIL